MLYNIIWLFTLLTTDTMFIILENKDCHDFTASYGECILEADKQYNVALVSINIPELYEDVSSILVKCNLAMHGYVSIDGQGKKINNLLYSFAGVAGEKITERPAAPIYIPTVNTADVVSITLMNEKGAPLKFKPGTVAVRLHVKEVHDFIRLEPNLRLGESLHMQKSGV